MAKKTKTYRPDLPLGWELLMRNVKEIENITQKGGTTMKYEKKKGGKKGGSNAATGGSYW